MSTYVKEYIEIATTTEERIQEPDKSLCSNQEYMVLDAIFHAHKAGGSKQAKQALKTAMRLVPAIARLLNDSKDDYKPPINDDGEEKHQPDDDEIAILLTDAWDKQFAFIYQEWRKYQNGCWVGISQAEIQVRIRQFLRHFRRVGVRVTQSRIRQIRDMMQDDLFISDEAIMQTAKYREGYLPMKNGLFNLKTLQLEPHTPDIYFINQLGFEYQPTATCPNWERFLSTSLTLPDDPNTPDKEMIMFVQEALAYSMTAQTHLKASFWLYGKPNSGKSTLLSFIRDFMGEFHATIDLNAMGNSRFGLTNIIGKHVVTFPEAEQGAVINDAIYKAITGGGDQIEIDRKNRDPINIIPVCKLWWGMNNAPRTTDRSGAMFDRLYPVLFNHTVPSEKRIYNLNELLMNERSGIFNWLIAGYRRLQSQGKFTACK